MVLWFAVTLAVVPCCLNRLHPCCVAMSAKTARRMGSGRFGHALTTAAKSGIVGCKSAKQNAKTLSADAPAATLAAASADDRNAIIAAFSAVV